MIRVPEDPKGFWLARLDADTRLANESHFGRWMRWLDTEPGWESVTPRELLIRQLEAEDPYVILDLAQTFVNCLVLRKSSKRKAYSVIRSFFMHNRCALPADPAYRIRGDRPPVHGLLSVNDIVEAVHAASIRLKSIILFKWQSFVDNERLVYANRYCSDQVVKQIQKGVHPVQIDISQQDLGGLEFDKSFRAARKEGSA